MVKDNGEKQKPEEAKICDGCKWFNLLLIDPRTKIGMGPCMNQDENAPFAQVMAHFAGPCETWELRPKQTIVQAPAGVVNKMKQERGIIQ